MCNLFFEVRKSFFAILYFHNMFLFKRYKRFFFFWDPKSWVKLRQPILLIWKKKSVAHFLMKFIRGKYPQKVLTFGRAAAGQ